MSGFPVCRVMIVALLIAVAGCGSSGWDTKATPNARIASERVGGFSSDDARLYRLGVQHAANAHQRLGALTIAQVVAQERSREAQRAEVAAKQRAWADEVSANANLRAEMRLANRSVPMYRDGKITGAHCEVTIDAGYYDAANEQDRDLINETVGEMCVGAYKLLGRGRERELPDDGLSVALYDLADNQLYSDVYTHR